jgi:putative endonuclease
LEFGNFLVLVDVTRRRSLDSGAPEDAVTALKIRRMTKTAVTYITRHRLTERMVRFDVVTMDASGLHHYPNAFEASGDYYF